MFVTVAICTWNRAKLLDATLSQMAALRVPEGVEWELLVVNNNCTDDTDEVLARHAETLPLRRLFEPRQGHSPARNCAIEAARGELLIWTDDDVLVDPEWLAEYVQAAREWPDAAYLGGPIDPWFESEPPDWIRANWETIRKIFVIRDFGGHIGPLRRKESPAGANMAFRTHVLREFRFNEALGRVGGTLTGADDTDVVGRFRRAGHQGVWVGTARVRHFIPSERLTKRFVRDWFVGAGRTLVRMDESKLNGRMLCGAPRWALAQFCRAQLRACGLSVFHGPRWFQAFRKAAQHWGVILEARERSKRPSGSVTDGKADASDSHSAPAANACSEMARSAP